MKKPSLHFLGSPSEEIIDLLTDLSEERFSLRSFPSRLVGIFPFRSFTREPLLTPLNGGYPSRETYSWIGVWRLALPLINPQIVVVYPIFEASLEEPHCPCKSSPSYKTLSPIGMVSRTFFFFFFLLFLFFFSPLPSRCRGIFS